MPECDTKPEGIEGTVEAFCEWKGDHDAKVAAIEARLQKAKDRNAAGSAAREASSDDWEENHKERMDAQCERIQIGCSEDTQKCEGFTTWGYGGQGGSGPSAENPTPTQWVRDDVQGSKTEMFWWQSGGNAYTLYVESAFFVKWCENWMWFNAGPTPNAKIWTGAGAASSLYATREEALANHPMPFWVWRELWEGPTYVATADLNEAQMYAIQEYNSEKENQYVYEFHGEHGISADANAPVEQYEIWSAEEAEQVDLGCDPSLYPASGPFCYRCPEHGTPCPEEE